MLLAAAVLTVALMAAAANAQPPADPGPQAAAATAEAATADQASREEEKAIRAEVDAFIKAYNAHDAKTLAALFVAGGEIVNEAGESVHGREAIQQTFAAIFQAQPKSQISVSIQSIRLLSPSMAMEDGTTTVTGKSGEGPEHNRYMVVHVKQDGRWQMASARDLPDEEASAGEELKQLGWLIGQWVDESPTALVISSYHWGENQLSILSEFKIQVGGRPAMTGTQQIRWDPCAKRLHSWVFDSEGGFGEGAWVRSGNQWIVKMMGVTRDGRAASATNVTTRTAKDRMTWQSRDRVVGKELLPNIDEIPIVRKPPQPGTAESAANREPRGESK
jgi:uncharacterized protein (TIGR02246 family)